MIPTSVFFVKGLGVHREKLASFERALRDAGIQHLNLVHVSSIFPPNCKIVSKEDGLNMLKPGQIVYVVLARAQTNEARRMLAASIGLALPADPNAYGYLSEHHSFGETEEFAGEYAEDLAAEMLASTLGVEFDPDKSYDEKREIFKISDKMVHTENITQAAKADRGGRWTSAVAAAMFVCDEYKSVRDIKEKKIKKKKKAKMKREIPDIDPNGD